MAQFDNCSIYLTLMINFLIIIKSELFQHNASLNLYSLCPSSCYCDKNIIYVSCVGKKFWDTLPEIPNTVIRLEISNYKVSSLLPIFLNRLNQLQELKFQEMNLIQIEDGSFQNLKNLERLDLSQNWLKEISKKTFLGVSNVLKHLDLSFNQIKIIEKAFFDCGLIEQLNLKNNLITNLTTNTFIGLRRLQYLNLDSNLITYIEVGSFFNLFHLAHLLISNNPISNSTRFDSMTPRLQYLDLSNISLTLIPRGIDPFVRDLQLAGNNISRICSGDFDNYIYLNILVLNENQIEDLEQDSLGRLDYLIRLWLNRNKLKKIPRNLPTSLRELYIEKNLITRVDELSLIGLVNLEWLYLQNNKIDTLEKGCFAGLKSLINLNLKNNQIQVLKPKYFKNLTKLKLLDLSNNPLKIFSSNCFQGLTSLSILYLSNITTKVTTKVTNLLDPLKSLKILDVQNSPFLTKNFINNQSLSSLSKIEELNLMHNQLTTIDINFINTFIKLKLVKLTHNKWNCDENIKPLLEWIKNYSKIFYARKEIKCSTPKNFQFKSLIELKLNYFPFINNTNITLTNTLKGLLNSKLINLSATNPKNVNNLMTINKLSSNSFSDVFKKHINQKLKPNEMLFKNNSYKFLNHNHTLKNVQFSKNLKTLNLSEKNYKLSFPLNSVKSNQFSLKNWNEQVKFGIIKTSTKPNPKNELSLIMTIKIVLGLLLISTLCFFMQQAFFKYKSIFDRKLFNRHKKTFKRRSSISYSPQKDDISILTISEFNNFGRNENDKFYLKFCKNNLYRSNSTLTLHSDIELTFK